MNAIIAQHIDSQSSASNMTRLSPNRFYLNNTSHALNGLHTLQGHFFSFRPGVGHLLMNINTVAGAFFSSSLSSLGPVEKNFRYIAC
jgi:hypothetical protein